MVDFHFADPVLARLYDLFCPGDQRGDFGFYLPLVLTADRVLDVGCGTGLLLRQARAEGHAGRLTGLDPAAAMLDVARAGEAGKSVEWVLGDLTSAPPWDAEFDLVVMTGHAFQVLTGDGQLRQALAAVRPALAPAGRFAFETRNPLAREWEQWATADAAQVTDGAGAVVTMVHDVDVPVTGELVSFTSTYSSPDWASPRRSRSTLRFLDAPTLSSLLAESGLQIEQHYGDWDRSLLRPDSPEIITIAVARAWSAGSAD